MRQVMCRARPAPVVAEACLSAIHTGDEMTSTIRPIELTCEYFSNPLGIDARRPRLSWMLGADARGAAQSAYALRAAETPEALTAGPWLWDTGKVASDQTTHIPYAGPDLRSGQRVWWQARAWDAADQASDWSAPACWEMGLLEPADWQAEWITPDWEEDTTQSQPAPVLRRAFTLDGPVKEARAYVTSLGLYELRLNGQRVGDGVLTPGWTSYAKRLQYQVYDVTGLLNAGDNAVGALLADGWYRGWLGFEGNRNTYGDRLALLFQLRVTYADGRTAVITSDAQWRATLGPVRMADIYMGETYDARLELPGWDRPGYDDGAWQGVRKLEHGKEMLVAQSGPFVKCQEEIRPIRLFRTPAGETVFDFGQNMVGWVRLRAQGPAGTTITLRHAEVLDQQGNFYTTNLRKARQTAQVTLKGGGVETYEPRFTFMGFRYVAVDGWPGQPDLDSLTGVVVHSDIPSTGSFECSNPLINQLQRNVVWGQKGNFVDVPTDCPQRDERLGWTGDAQVFIRTACFNRDVAAFFTKWLADLAAEQFPNGGVPMVVPDPMKRSPMASMGGGGSAAWADASTICPWTLYQCYGDARILERQYASMAAWVGYMRGQAGERCLWNTGFHFGDWLDYRGRGAMDAAPITDKDLIATAFFAYSTSLVQQAAQALGKSEDAAMYADLLRRIKAAFTAEFVSANGRVGPNSQTAYVLALHFDLLPDKLRPLAAARLAEEVREFGYHLTTGFVGTPYLCHVLSRFGYTDLAYELLNQESYPSWLYPVKKGATTIWERWDGIKPDGSFQDEGMNSFNHYAYGAIGDWLYRVTAGIDTAADGPGYKHLVIAPQPGGGLTHARAALKTMHGEAVSAWQLTDSEFRLQVTVPPNTRATVRIPAARVGQVTESGAALRKAAGVISARAQGGAVAVEIGSGSYDFASTGLTLGQAMANVRHVAGRLDTASGLRDLLADERARAVLVKHLGEDALKVAVPPWFGDVPLDGMTRFAPHLLTPERLQAIQQDLVAL
jgi:alpha-L-rhamnosidase